MSNRQLDEKSPLERIQGRGCGLVFICLMTAAAIVFGGAMGVFAWLLEDARSQITALDTWRPKSGSRIYSADGELLGEYNIEYRNLVRLSEVPLHVQKAVVATEDDKFYTHKGVRPDAILNALLFIARTGQVRGGSTITQQVVRNAEDATHVSRERTLARKLREAIVALQIEREFTKDEILELYLNQIFLGGSAHGIEAGAQQYFGKSCSRLSLSEGAILAGIIRSPNRNRPDRFPERAQHLRNIVLGQMLENGYITPEQYEDAVRQRVADLVLTPEEKAARASEYFQPNRFKAAYFVEEVRKSGMREGRFDKEALLEQGLEITTTIDMRLQRAAEEALFAELDAFDERKRNALRRAGREEDFVPVSGALVCLDNRPEFAGFVRALVGGRDWEKEKYNTVTQARRQPGSSVKPFVWAAAIGELGLTPSDIRMDSPYIKVSPSGQVWNPQNFSGGYSGPVTLRYALEKSINIVSIRLAEEVGVEKVKEYIRRAGFSLPIPDHVGLTIALGAHSVTPMDQCVAYSTFAKGGRYDPPVFIQEIRNRDGLPIFQHKRAPAAPDRGFSPELAYVMTHMLRGVCESPWGTGGRTSPLKRPRAGKTGTTNDARDVWFCGYTPEYTCVVWIGYRDNRSLGQGADYTGGRRAAPVWTKFMIEALKDMPVQDFPKEPPPGVVMRTTSRMTSRGSVSGFTEAFIKGTENKAVESYEVWRSQQLDAALDAKLNQST